MLKSDDILKEAKISVLFSSGEARNLPAESIDFMLAEIPAAMLTEDQKDAADELDFYAGGGIYELYAEVDPLEYHESAGMTAEELTAHYEEGLGEPSEVEDATKAALTALILEQADKIKFPHEKLIF